MDRGRFPREGEIPCGKLLLFSFHIRAHAPHGSVLCAHEKKYIFHNPAIFTPNNCYYKIHRYSDNNNDNNEKRYYNKNKQINRGCL